MHHTYILKSKSNPDKYYTGLASDISLRLAQHNAGESSYIAKYIPWKILFYASFETRKLANDFEKYLKTPSGRAFRNKRLVSRVG